MAMRIRTWFVRSIAIAIVTAATASAFEPLAHFGLWPNRPSVRDAWSDTASRGAVLVEARADRTRGAVTASAHQAIVAASASAHDVGRGALVTAAQVALRNGVDVDGAADRAPPR